MINKLTVKYLIEEIKNLAIAFPEIDFIYGIDEAANQHIVDIRPPEMLASEAFSKAESDLLENMMLKFPEEELFFISNDKFIKIEKPLFIKLGSVPKIGITPIALSNSYSFKIACSISMNSLYDFVSRENIKIETNSYKAQLKLPNTKYKTEDLFENKLAA